MLVFVDTFDEIKIITAFYLPEMTESTLVLLPEVICRSRSVKVPTRYGKTAQFKYCSQSKPFQTESALKDPGIDG